MILYESNNLHVDIHQFSCPKLWNHSAITVVFFPVSGKERSLLCVSFSCESSDFLLMAAHATTNSFIFSSVFLVSAGRDLPVATLIRAKELKTHGE